MPCVAALARSGITANVDGSGGEPARLRSPARGARPARGRSRGSPLADAQASRGLGPKVQPLFASELERLTNAALRATMRELQARLKVKEELPKDVAARRANPVTITKKQRAKLLQVFHSDTGATATKKELDDAFVILNALKFKVID
jgi:hypothetical protein